MKYVILENIRSAYNVGAIFRTADATGVTKIFIVGYSPTPTDRFGRVQPEISKTSLGASETVPWVYYENIAAALESLHSEDVSIVAVEQTKNSVTLKDFVIPDKVCYILGNEVDGVSKEALAAVDTIVELPMLGTKESLNVSVTAGVVLYHDLI